MQSWRDNLIRLAPYVAGEQPSIPGLIKLNTNENPFPPSPAVVSAIRRAGGEDLARYPDPDAAELASVLASRHGVDADAVFVGNGSDEVLAFAFRAFFGSDRPVLFPDITYSFYPVWCRLFGIPYEEVPLDGGFRMDPAGYARECGGAVLANPNAPTGIAEGTDFFRRVLESCPRCVVIVDEAYAGFGAESVVPLLGEYGNLFVARTFSKSHSLAGIRLGYGIGGPELIAALRAVKDSFNSYTVSRITQEAGCAAAADDAYYADTASKLVAARQSFTESLRGLGFTVPGSSANFVFASHPSVGAEALYRWLRDRAILVRWFDKPRIRDWLRITIGLPEEMDALLAAVREYMEGGFCDPAAGRPATEP
jgi:histidinol-phosphate aminotransferase